MSKFWDDLKKGYRRPQLEAMLPEVGDHLKRVPAYRRGDDGAGLPPQDCVVEYVHEDHLWFMVQYISTGFRECVKVPDIRQKQLERRWPL